MRARFLEFVPGLLAGLAGGFGGYLLVGLVMSRYGYWVPILPGALAGLACGQVSPVASRARGVVLAVLMVGVMIYAEWRLFVPNFATDGTLLDFARHAHELSGLHLGLMAVNVLLAFWWGRERGIIYDRAGGKPGGLRDLA